MIRFFFRESGKIQGVVNNMKRKSNMDKQGRGKKLSVAAKVFLIVISVLLSLLVVAAFFAKYYLDKVNYAEKETSTFADKEVIAEYFPEESSSKSEEILKMDEKLKEHAYIVPGLGDAGDRIFCTK